MNEPNNIPLDDATAEELLKLQADVAAAQAKVLELTTILAAYSAVPSPLCELVRQMADKSAIRDEKIKKVAALAGIDLDSPEEAGRWGWSPSERVLRKV
jgi:hypothetical protein